MNIKAYGFTIVELLIVIVVIGILAAISIVAYNNVQNNAYDSTVKGDLSNLAKKYELYKTESSAGTYPLAALAGGVTNPDFQLAVSKSAYKLDGNQYNLLNCSLSSGTGYAVVAQSKSGKYFAVSSSNTSIREVTSSITLADTSSCPVVAPGSSAYGAGYGGGVWRAWTNG